MFEHHGEPLLARRLYYRRVLLYASLALSVVTGALAIGILGYHYLDGLSWLDSLLNASMILAGMGPVDPILTTPGKIFASCYALFSGLVFLAAAGTLFAPMLHRLLHHFHAELGGDESA